MPIEVGIWKLGKTIDRVQFTPMPSEGQLQEIIAGDGKMVERRGDEPWNGEYQFSFGEGERRRWADAMNHGYIAAGGGSWHSNTVHQLEPGDRIWVNVPGCGL
jgi:hypothetical protein